MDGEPRLGAWVMNPPPFLSRDLVAIQRYEGDINLAYDARRRILVYSLNGNELHSVGFIADVDTPPHGTPSIDASLATNRAMHGNFDDFIVDPTKGWPMAGQVYEAYGVPKKTWSKCGLIAVTYWGSLKPHGAKAPYQPEFSAIFDGGGHLKVLHMIWSY